MKTKRNPTLGRVVFSASVIWDELEKLRVKAKGRQTRATNLANKLEKYPWEERKHPPGHVWKLRSKADDYEDLCLDLEHLQDRVKSLQNTIQKRGLDDA